MRNWNLQRKLLDGEISVVALREMVSARRNSPLLKKVNPKVNLLKISTSTLHINIFVKKIRNHVTIYCHLWIGMLPQFLIIVMPHIQLLIIIIQYFPSKRNFFVWLIRGKFIFVEIKHPLQYNQILSIFS